MAYTVDSFGGGITDAYMTASPDCAYQLNNFLLDENKKPYTIPGLEAFGTRIPGGSRVSGIYIGNEPFGRPLFFVDDTVINLKSDDTFGEVVGPENNVACPNKGANNFESCLIWQKQLIYASGPSTVLPHRIYSPTSTTFTALTLGLPQVASDPTFTPVTAGATFTYIYAVHHYYTFTDYDGVTYEEQGPVREITVQTGAAITVGEEVEITDIPELANSASTNYDVDNIKIKIFRTINNGTTLFFVGEVTNGTTTFTDDVTDANLDDNVTIYTAGDVLEWDQPPSGTQFVTQVNNTFWYATSRSVIHSIQGAPGACPADFETFVDQRVTGLSNIISFPVLFCDQSVYRIDGVFDEFGNDGFDLREISKTAGCVSNRSIVAITGGLVWAGNGGFYFTDGYKVIQISGKINERYKTFRNESVVGTYDAGRNIVVWIVNSSANSSVSPNDAIAILHLDFGISEYSIFTTAYGDGTFYPRSVAYSESSDIPSDYRGKLLFGEARGYFLWWDDLSYTNPAVTPELHPSEWKKKTIIYRYESVALDLGIDPNRAYVTNLVARLENETDIAVEFQSRRDDSGSWGSLSEFREDGAILWGISEYPWNDDTDTASHDWNSQRLVEGSRHFPSGTLRSTRRQIAITNAKTYVTKSDDKGTATTVAATRTVTLDDGSEFWPEDCEDYEIAFDSDSYATYYKIRSRDSDTQITVFDPYETLTDTAARAWQMRGYRKHERARIISYSIEFEPEMATHPPNRGTAGLVNA